VIRARAMSCSVLTRGCLPFFVCVDAVSKSMSSSTSSGHRDVIVKRLLKPALVTSLDTGLVPLGGGRVVKPYGRTTALAIRHFVSHISICHEHDIFFCVHTVTVYQQII
jgi:hypothetical protein